MEKGCTNYTGTVTKFIVPNEILSAHERDKIQICFVFVAQVIDDKKSVLKHYSQLGKHFAEIKDYRTAEQLFIDVQMYKEAIGMYIEAGN